MSLVWRRMPVLVRAVIVGVAVAAAGTMPWALLVRTNIDYWLQLPWAVGPAAIYLWLFWWYLQGSGWPSSTAEARRLSLRANPLSSVVWSAALLAGVLGLATLVVFMRVMNRLIVLPAEHPPDVSQAPLITVVGLVLMSALVAGIVEESAFRGYMQSAIERQHGPVLAIFVTGILFFFAHLSHPEVGLALVPYYLAVAAIYGALAYFTNSIYPSMVLHAGGNILGSLDLFTRSQAEWQAPVRPEPLVWHGGADASFWTSCGVLLLLGPVAVWAYVWLGRVAREHGIGRRR